MKIEKECGFVEFRLPNIPEMMILLGEIGVDGSKELSAESNQNLIYIGRLIIRMKPFIGRVDLTNNDGLKVEKYEDCLNYFEFMEILSETATEIFKAMELSQKKRPA